MISDTTAVTAEDSPPAHVPHALVVDFDYFGDPGMKTNPREVYLRLRGAQDIVWTPRNGGHWIATRGEVINEVFRDPDRFSSFPLLIPRSVSGPTPAPFAEMNPPEHSRYRQLLAPLTGPRAVAAFRDFVRELMIELTEEVAPRGECDFAVDIAQKLPTFVMMRWLDLPYEDRFKLMRWVDQLIGDPDPLQRAQARVNSVAYLTEVVAARQAVPGDDLISQVVNAEIDGWRPEQDAAVSMVRNLVHGGLDTVRAMMSFIAWFLADNSEQRRSLVDDPSLIPHAVEELLRWFAIPSIGRSIVSDIDFHGVRMLAGEQILLPLVLYGADDRIQAAPHAVDFTGAKPKHMSFGSGPHFCPGSHLARIELTTFLEEWLKCIPDFHRTPGTAPVTSGGIVAGVSSLPLSWTPR